jgi:tetratricopeptide (TPR) repeat protein
MNHMRSLLPLFFILVSSGHSLWSADAPTAEEWSPVEQALSEDTATAGTKLAALIATYPRWVDGQRTMAEWRMRHGQADEALASAKQALALNPSDAAAAAIVVQALGVLHRPGEAFALADKFVGEKDPNGWVNFRAAEVALDVNDRAKAELHLSLASGRVKSPPAEFSFLEARISAASGDLDRAELSLTRAVATNPRLWDGWYELGVVQLRQAERKTLVSRREYLEKSEASFTKVTAIHAKDALSWFGLGRAQLIQAQDSFDRSSRRRSGISGESRHEFT